MNAAAAAAVDGGARRLAWLAFATGIVLAPVPARVVLVARPEPGIYATYTDVAIGWGDVAILATLIAWAASLAARPRRVRVGPPIVAIPVGVVLAVAWIGVPFAVDPVGALDACLRLTLVVALGCFVVNEVGRIDRLLMPAFAMIALQALVAIGQGLTQASLGLGFLGERTLDATEIGISIITGPDGTRWLRAYGLTGHPNILGGVLAFGLLVVMAAARWAGVHLGRTIVLVAIVAVGSVALLLTMSRSSWLALGIGSAVGLVMLTVVGDRDGRRRWLLSLAVALLACLPLLPMVAPYLAARTTLTAPIESETRSLDERGALVEASLAVIAERPVLGAGAGGLPVAMRDTDPGFAYPYAPAHLVVLTAAAELGLVGGVAVLVLLVAPWWRLARPPGRAAWTADLAGASALVAATTVIGLLDHYPWSSTVGRMWVAIALGLWVAAWVRTTEGRADRAAAADAG